MSSLCGERLLIDGYNLRTPEFPKGKDFYAMLASTAFGKDYWECTEFDKDGKFNGEGKARRQAGKVIQLGVSYGMGVKLLVEGINNKKAPGEPKMTIEEGEKMMTDFFSRFKALAAWKNYNFERLADLGYMETGMGRRRRLYDTWLPDYDVEYRDWQEFEDIFFNIGNHVYLVNHEETKKAQDKIAKETNPWKNKEYAESLKENPNYQVSSNGGYKSRPKTQANNYVIQGSSAELTKRAMVAIYNHPDSKRLGIGIEAPVHDEILIEGWMEYRDEVLKVLTECMSGSARGVFEVQMVCDGVVETSWNVGHFMDKIQKEHNKKGIPIEQIQENYKETDPEDIKRMVEGNFDIETEYYKAREDL